MAIWLKTKDDKSEESKSLDYTIRVNKRQLAIVVDALEEWFRLRMGQVFDLSDALAFLNYEYKKDDPEFDDRINRRDEGELLLNQAMLAFSKNNIYHWRKSDEVQTAIDMWHVIRHFCWEQEPEEIKKKYSYTTEAGPVFQFGPEPLIEVEKARD